MARYETRQQQFDLLDKMYTRRGYYECQPLAWFCPITDLLFRPAPRRCGAAGTAIDAKVAPHERQTDGDAVKPALSDGDPMAQVPNISSLVVASCTDWRMSKPTRSDV